ncbi:MAG: 5'-deoxynucleotidase [Oscillospiraceae bacterium]|nr:5'-deoxynucleotidase [Oscillospiraceae bacterium]
MASGFGAMMARMNYITRWGLMRSGRAETLSEHAAMTALVAHILACCAIELFGAEDVDEKRVVCRALYHDAAEILTGDMPTPVKHSNESLRAEYKKVEKAAQERLLGMLPETLKGRMSEVFDSAALSERERRIIKAADKLAALIKCIEEEAGGNTEFASAKRSTLATLAEAPLPETKYFIEEFLPAYSLTLDELLETGNGAQT